jgi:hypothetical protein
LIGIIPTKSTPGNSRGNFRARVRCIGHSQRLHSQEKFHLGHIFQLK